MKTEFDLVRYDSRDTFVKKSIKKQRLKKTLKSLGLLVLMAIVYLFSLKTSGFYKTNVKLLVLILSSIAGLIGFFVIYAIILGVAKICYFIKKSKNNRQVDYNIEVVEFLSDKKFKYDANKGFKYNLLDNYTAKILLVVKQIAGKYNKDKKYYYVNYTSLQALDVADNLLLFIHNKIDGFFVKFKLQDLPLTVIESTVNKYLEKDKSSEEKPSFFAKLFQITTSKIANGVLFAFRGEIENLANEILEVIAIESFKTFDDKKLKVVETPSVEEVVYD